MPGATGCYDPRRMDGLHLIADLRGCTGPAPLDDLDALRALCLRAVAESGLRAVGELFHPFVDAEGRAQGVTGVVLLAESHVALHTWPELGAVTADAYVCNFGADNTARAEALMARLVEAFAPADCTLQRLNRGGVAEGSDRRA
jgi:S-adenosylmethionine decarboxylase proenzyme